MKLLYGVTPPRADYPIEKIESLSAKRLERFQALSPDALILYDVQDESGRTSEPRPFPWTPTLPPLEWDRTWLTPLLVPRIYYRPVSDDTEETLTAWLRRVAEGGGSVVFVGTASSSQSVRMPLHEAYRIKRDRFPDIPLGGIAIPERHRKSGSEHIRVMEKIGQGCHFFITQCIYDAQSALDFLSDYHYGCQDKGLDAAPIYFTHTPCGSLQTLHFMKWLGIGIPRWLENELSRSDSILGTSVDACLDTARTLKEYCERKGLPHGFNIESVSIRKEEIEASVALFDTLRRGF